MTKAGMAVTYAGANADLNDPIGWALRRLAYTVSDITNVTSAEVAAVASDDLDEMLLLAEYRLLESVQTNLDDVDVEVGPRSEKLSQLAAQVEKRLARLLNQLETDYGFGLSALTQGTFTFEFAEHGGDTYDE